MIHAHHKVSNDTYKIFRDDYNNIFTDIYSNIYDIKKEKKKKKKLTD